MAKMNKFAKKAAELEAWSDLLDVAIRNLQSSMDVKEDENGNYVTDKDGNEVRIPPKEDDTYSYSRYIGWSEVVKALENMKL